MHEPEVRDIKRTQSLQQMSNKPLKEVTEAKRNMNTEHVVEQQNLQKLFSKEKRWLKVEDTNFPGISGDH